MMNEHLSEGVTSPWKDFTPTEVDYVNFVSTFYLLSRAQLNALSL